MKHITLTFLLLMVIRYSLAQNCSLNGITTNPAICWAINCACDPKNGLARFNTEGVLPSALC
jgi:hypothetical protein